MSEVYFKDVNVLKGEIFSLLKKEGYQAVDMHYHTRYSYDGLASIPAVLRKCEKGSFGTAITDHNHIGGAIKAAKINKKVFFVPGMEINCHTGVHILLHFYNAKEMKEFFDKEIAKTLRKNPWFIGLTHDDLVDRASKYNCLITAPHPYGPGFMGIMRFRIHQKTIKKINAIEAINGCCLRDMNKKAISWGERISKPFTGGSDGHCLAELGTSFTLCKASNVEEFLNEIKKSRSIVLGHEEQILSDAIHTVEKLAREEKKTPPRIMRRIWKDWGRLEWNYLKKLITKHNFIHYYKSHHHHIKTSDLKKHKHTTHLTKYSK
ncbi:PHP-associated domain-containing protein [Nanoarchaeota archaeon]